MKIDRTDADGTRNVGPSLEAALTRGREAFLAFLMRRLRDRADAEDVLQDFCIRVLARKGQLRRVERMDAWLFAILRSTLTDHRRKSARRGRLVDALTREPGPGAEESEQMSEFCRCVIGLISRLRPSEADLLRQVDFGEANRSALAAELGLTSGALAVRLHRARAALREALLEHCGPCCRDDFADCSCQSVGCENARDGSHCRPAAV
ncbi:sigma-70 family RNA polymerase sigma factor [Stappia sp. F7233]|uniref:Sigma-70 family RNA polymerase sigma factor n=1 Tax=Stappia albiluteola TaxID=2758565 RepID=A0A839A7H0_9HYPH|nr:sigma-70 family RNA polymerase sigma factor [Stappia albiluteola]MBA5775510.1 sigma-70 family RNA polymerase sigma factor [Stappia albiluteola]